MSYFFAYVTWDFVMMYRLGACSGKGDVMELIHHTLAFVCSASAIYVGKYTVTMGVFTLIVEGSTPFYNMRKYLVAHDMGSGPVYLFNGLLGLLSFFFCRVVFNVYMVSQQLYPALVRDEWGVQDPLPVQYMIYFLFALYLVLCALNFIWFYVIIAAVCCPGAPDTNDKEGKNEQLKKEL
jgi:hypothetical protein